jgi:hypothetical protein
MKMEEDCLHLAEPRLAACELHWMTTRHELNVCSLLRSCAAVNECLTQCVCGEAPMLSDCFGFVVMTWSRQAHSDSSAKVQRHGLPHLQAWQRHEAAFCLRICALHMQEGT